MLLETIRKSVRAHFESTPLLQSVLYWADGDIGAGFDAWEEAVRLDPTLSQLDTTEMSVEDLCFEIRPKSDLPTVDDLSYWLGEHQADDQWHETDGDRLIRAVLRFGTDVIVWQDEPQLTNSKKEDVLSEYKYREARTEYEEEVAGIAEALEELLTGPIPREFLCGSNLHYAAR